MVKIAISSKNNWYIYTMKISLNFIPFNELGIIKEIKINFSSPYFLYNFLIYL